MILRDPARWAIRQDVVTAPTARLVNAALARHANSDARCRPSIKALACATGLSRRTIQTNIALLERAGLVTVERGGGWVRRSTGRASTYALAMAIQSPDGHLPCSPFLDWAWAVEVGSWVDRWILVALGQFADAIGKCNPSAAEIKRATGLANRAIRMSLARLEVAGLIIREQTIGRAARIRLLGAATEPVDNSQIQITDPGTSCTVAAATPASRAQNPGTSCTLTTLNNPDTDTCARGSAAEPVDNFEPDDVDPLLAEVLTVCGVPAEEAQRLHGHSEPSRWRDELRLDRTMILAVLRRVLRNARRGNPDFLPTSLAYFTEEMRREAGRRLQPALTPIIGRRWAKRTERAESKPRPAERAISRGGMGFSAIVAFTGRSNGAAATEQLTQRDFGLHAGNAGSATGSPASGPHIGALGPFRLPSTDEPPEPADAAPKLPPGSWRHRGSVARSACRRPQ